MKKTILMSAIMAATLATAPTVSALTVADCQPAVGKTLGDLFGTPLPTDRSMTNFALTGLTGWTRSGSTLVIFKPTYTLDKPSLTNHGGERCHYSVMDGTAVKGSMDLVPPAPAEPAAEPVAEPAVEPMHEGATEPGTEGEVEPMAEPAKDPAHEGVTEPAKTEATHEETPVVAVESGSEK
jgi:hypothetical protein